jgi:hypothetical protein
MTKRLDDLYFKELTITYTKLATLLVLFVLFFIILIIILSLFYIPLTDKSITLLPYAVFHTGWTERNSETLRVFTRENNV